MQYRTLFFILTIFLFKGNSGVLDHSVGESATGFLTSLPPENPILKLPENNSVISEDTVQLEWFGQIHTSSYRIEISESDDFEVLIFENNSPDTVCLFSQFKNNTEYYWRVEASNVAGQSELSETFTFYTNSTTEIEPLFNNEANKYKLEIASPNPFTNRTQIIFSIPEHAYVSLQIFDLTGKKVKSIISEYRSPGTHKTAWRGLDDRGKKLAKGLYICTLESSGFIISRKIILLP